MWSWWGWQLHGWCHDVIVILIHWMIPWCHAEVADSSIGKIVPVRAATKSSSEIRYRPSWWWWLDDNQMMIKKLLQNCYHLHLHWWVGNQIFCCLILKRDIFCWSWIYWPNINTLPSNSRHKSRNFDISSDDDIIPKINMRRKSTLIIVNFESLRGAPKSAILCILPTDSHQFLNI